MTFQVIFRPTDGIVRNAQITDAGGTTYVQQVVGSAAAVISGNNRSVLQSLVNNSVQPNSAQLTGLQQYLALIQAGSVTTTVETALTNLQP